MSEYQYYDFRAIDRSLTPSQMEELNRLSSRAQITNRRAEFVYNYGDFRGNPEQLMQEMFDMMLYINNWGRRQLTFRLPGSLFDVSQCRDFFISDEVDHYRSGTQIILNLDFEDEEHTGQWVEGSGWLNDLLPLRDELLRGDFRVLYLAWFKAAEKALNNEDIDEDSPEPLVPAGLNELSAAQKAFAELLEIDKVDIEALAQNSPALSQQATFKPEEWLPKLSEAEKNDYLLRLSRGEERLELHLNRRLKMLWQQANADSDKESGQDSNRTQTAAPQFERRSIQDVLNACSSHQYAVEKEAKRKAEAAAENKRQIAAKKREKYLNELRLSQGALWKEAEQLIQLGQAKSYAQAADHLYDLYELAGMEGELTQFNTKLAELTQKYQRRRKFIDCLREKQLLDD